MSNASITDLESLLEASMDDIDDLPPVGVPPSGHYNLKINAERVVPEDEDKNEYIRLGYEVEAVNQLDTETEADQVAVGMKFSQNYSPMKNDGTLNEFGIGLLKEAVAPFSAHFGTSKMGETIALMKDVSVAASLTRTKNRKDAERFNFRLKNVTIL